MNDTYEFYSPFAHVRGRYEWARIHSPTHGSFDCFILIHGGTDKPVTVYVSSDAGAAFMRDRYPQSACYRVAADALRLRSSGEPPVVTGELTASEGPVRSVSMVFTSEDALPVARPYGSSDFLVWGSSYTCEGVDLELPAAVSGEVKLDDATVALSAEPGVVTLGSFGHIVRRP